MMTRMRLVVAIAAFIAGTAHAQSTAQTSLLAAPTDPSNQLQDLFPLLGTDPCEKGSGYEKFYKSLTRRTKNGNAALGKGPVLPAGIKLSGAPTLQSKGNHSVVTVPISGKWLGLTVTKLEQGVGHENGISFSGVYVAEKSSVAAKSFPKIKLKPETDRKRQGVFSYTDDEEYARITISPIASGGAEIHCDVSM